MGLLHNVTKQEMIVAYSKALSQHLPRGSEANQKNSVRIASVLAKYQTGYLPTTNERSCCFSLTVSYSYESLATRPQWKFP